jgi:TonB family protein
MRMRYALILALVFCYCPGPAASAQSQQSSNETRRKLIKKVEPRYPDIAKRMNLGGTVKVVAVVAPDGKVTKVEAVGGSPILVEAAQSAVTQWKYAPAGGESKEPVELHFTP